MMRLLPWAYLLAAFVFIYLPVGTLVLFSFQEGGLPVPPFEGPSLRWYGDILSDAMGWPQSAPLRLGLLPRTSHNGSGCA